MTEFRSQQRPSKSVSAALFRSAIEECGREIINLKKLITDYRACKTEDDYTSVQGKIDHSKQILFRSFDEATKHSQETDAKELKHQEDAAEKVLEVIEEIQSKKPRKEEPEDRLNGQHEETGDRIKKIHR